MFLAFSRHPADAVVLEVGLGGKYDATNVVARPAMTMIQPVGLDHHGISGQRHRRHRGARRRASSSRGLPLVVGPQDEIAREVILRRADQPQRAGLRVRPGFLQPPGTWPHGL